MSEEKLQINNWNLDIDECSQGSHMCDANSKCTNILGSFKCNCNPGFSGDGTKCEGTEKNILYHIIKWRR